MIRYYYYKFIIAATLFNFATSKEAISPRFKDITGPAVASMARRRLANCTQDESIVEVRFEYGKDPNPLIRYSLFNTNGTMISEVYESFDDSTEEETFYNKQYCLDLSKCFAILFPVGEPEDLKGYLSYYDYEFKYGGKIEKGKADGLKLIKLGNCPSHTCDEGQAELSIQMVGNSAFNFTIYNSARAIITKNEGKDKTQEMSYDEAQLCLDASGCYKGWFAKDVNFYHINYNGILVGQGYGGGKVSFGRKNCSLCKSKPLLVDSSSYDSRADNIMSILMGVSSTESFIDTESPQYRAACWIIHDDLYEVTASDERLVQRYVLALLYYSTHGWDWYDDYLFLEPVSECGWNDGSVNGVYCDKNGNIVNVHFDYNNLQGIIVSELSKLRYLELLELDYNSLQGTIPVEFLQLEQLREIDLEDNYLSGTIPEDLFQMENLQEIQLHTNMLTGTLPYVFRLPNLKKLFLSDNLLSGTIPEELFRSLALVRIQLYKNHFEGTISSSIGKLPYLDYVNIKNNKLSGTIPSEFGELINLQFLDLSNNMLSSVIPEKISDLINLRYISFSKNQLTGTIPLELGNLYNLNLLDFSYNFLNGEIPLSLDYLSRLQYLYLQSNNITGQVSENLCHHFESTTFGQYGDDYDKDYEFVSDCAGMFIEEKVYCPCCTECYDDFSFGKPFGVCNGAELLVEFQTQYGESKIKDTQGTLIVKDGPYDAEFYEDLVTNTYTACIPATGCYTMFTTGKTEYSVTVNDELVDAGSISDEGKTVLNFGFESESRSIRKDRCDNITLYQKIAPPNSRRRFIFDQLAKMSGIDRVNASISPQYKSGKWLTEEDEMNKNSELTDLSIIQRYVLGIFYYSTSGADWINKDNWMKPTHECNWYGISCYHDTTIIGINLAENNVTGPLPFEMGELKPLQNITLPKNALNSSIPVEIANVHDLRVLELRNNTLSGRIPSTLGAMMHLEHLSLSYNSLSGTIPAEMKSLTQLVSLGLHKNALTGSLPQGIFNLNMLRKLDVGRNFLYGSITMNTSLSNLVYLDLSVNSFTGTVLDSIYSLTELEVLNLAQNKFGGSIPSSIGNLTGLQRLYLNTNELTGEIPNEISNLENIIDVSLSYNSLRGTIPNELQKLDKLQLLYLHGNQLYGNAIELKNVDRYITDCGNTLGSPAAVTCPHCTHCCNSEGDCLKLSRTWPKMTQKGNFGSFKDRAGIVVIVALLSACVVMLVISSMLMGMQERWKCLPEVRTPVRGLFAESSVYKFFLSKNWMGLFIASATVAMQTAVFFVFIDASDFSSQANMWEYSVDCPNNSLDCMETRQTTFFGWVTLAFVVLGFLLQDIFFSVHLLYESILNGDLRHAFASLVLTFITVLAIITSFLFNYASSVTNVSIMLESAALLFLCDLDEAIYSGLEVLDLKWMTDLCDEIESMREIACHKSMIARNSKSKENRDLPQATDANILEIQRSQSHNDNMEVEHEETQVDDLESQRSCSDHNHLDFRCKQTQDVLELQRSNMMVMDELNKVKEEFKLMALQYEEMKKQFEVMKSSMTIQSGSNVQEHNDAVIETSTKDESAVLEADYKDKDSRLQRESSMHIKQLRQIRKKNRRKKSNSSKRSSIDRNSHTLI